MALYHYWVPFKKTSAVLSGSPPTTDAQGQIHAGTASALRLETDTLLAVLYQARFNVRANPDMAHDIPNDWFVMSDCYMVAGFQPSATGVYPYIDQVDQFSLLGLGAMPMQGALDPLSPYPGLAWYETPEVVEFKGQRKGSGNPGQFPTLYLSMFWGTADLLSGTPGYTFDWMLEVRGRALFGSTSV